MAAANQYLERHYLPAYNVEFGQPAVEVGSTFIPCLGANFKAIRCEHFWRQVRPDNCVSFEALILQIPRHRHNCHFVKATVSVRRYRVDTTGRAATAASSVDEMKILIFNFYPLQRTGLCAPLCPFANSACPSPQARLFAALQ